MASIALLNDLTPVTIHLIFEGHNRRLRLPLCDLAPSVLPQRLRSVLEIPVTSEAIFERYSDTAAAFIVLDSNNPQVYRQLYRAARAKSKLHMKVTIISQHVSVKSKQSCSALAQHTRPSQSASKIEKKPIPPTRNSLKKTFFTGLTNNGANTVNDLPRKSCRTNQSKASTTNNSATRLSDHPKPDSKLNSKASEAPKKTTSHSTPSTSETTASVTTETSKSGEKHIPETSIQSSNYTNNSQLEDISVPSKTVPAYAVACNNCNVSVSNEHYHCCNCDGGDYDLCLECVAGGYLCPGEDHWLIKRFFQNDKVVTSITETISPKVKPPRKNQHLRTSENSEISTSTRICNACIREFSEERLVNCTTCLDYDLCLPCHVAMQHGHHPSHAFEPVSKDSIIDSHGQALLAPGRNVSHQAICDGCNQYILGVRHKCLDCPDWDFCSLCAANANASHPSHRFVLIYEPHHIVSNPPRNNRTVHDGIYCDGPLCHDPSSFISGDRYKCAVCDNIDFCAGCEASPSNNHNPTHPLIKLKTPVRQVNVTTLGEDQYGHSLPTMGDSSDQTTHNSVTTPIDLNNTVTRVRTICDFEPSEIIKAECTKSEVVSHIELEKKKSEPEGIAVPSKHEELKACFLRDDIADGTIMSPNLEFEQTWYLRNDGTTSWPAGCFLKFDGGSSMSINSSSQLAHRGEILPVAGSSICTNQVAPGSTIGFKVPMKAPSLTGNFVSYWHLTTPDGNKIGHRLWCDIRVENQELPLREISKPNPDVEGSQMVFPTLEKESPPNSIHQELTTKNETDEDCDRFVEESLDDLESDTGFMTDDEYEILEASDDVYSSEHLAKTKN